MYKLSQNPDYIYRIDSDGNATLIPLANSGDALLYQQWLVDGNVPLPADLLPVVVREIDDRRLRLALSQLNLLDTVEAAIATLDRAAQIDWDRATIIREDYPLVVALSTNLGLDTDAIFTLAISLP